MQKRIFHNLLMFFILILSSNLIAESKTAPNSPLEDTFEEDSNLNRGKGLNLRTSDKYRVSHQLFHPEDYKYLVGFESTSASLGVLGANSIVIGNWWETWGLEFLIGYTKNEDSSSSSVDTNNNTIANTGTTTTTFSGTKNNHTGSLGTVLKAKVFQNHWVQVYGGAFVGVNYFFKTNYQSGSKVETFTDLNSTGNKSVTETSLGNVEVKRTPQVAIGPKLGAEFYPKWIPHLAVGFSTGIATYFGGNTTTTSSLRTRTFTVVNGVDQPASADATRTTVTETSPGIKGVTFGIGGTTFQVTGVFTIRYVW